MENNSFESLLKVIKVFRVARLVKLVKNIKGIQKLVQTIIFSLPKLVNAFSLLILSFFLFSILF